MPQSQSLPLGGAPHRHRVVCSGYIYELPPLLPNGDVDEVQFACTAAVRAISHAMLLSVAQVLIDVKYVHPSRLAPVVDACVRDFMASRNVYAFPVEVSLSPGTITIYKNEGGAYRIEHHFAGMWDHDNHDYEVVQAIVARVGANRPAIAAPTTAGVVVGCHLDVRL